MQINSHLSVLVHDLAKKWGEKTALTFRKFGSDQWQSVSFNLFSLRVKQVSNALLNLGAKPLDKIAVFSQKLCALSVHRLRCVWYQGYLCAFLCQQQRAADSIYD